MMIQKYCAYHTLVLIFLGIFFAIADIGNGVYLTLDSFETFYGKVLFVIIALYIIVPALVNVFFMLWDMLKNGRWLYFFCTFLFVYVVTVLYYFKVYGKR
jgi:hypothetical protein